LPGFVISDRTPAKRLWPIPMGVQCDVVGCLAQVQSDLDQSLSTCGSPNQVDILAYERCVNSYKIWARQNEESCRTRGCPFLQDCCGNKCVDVSVDNQNCGECSKVCTGHKPGCCWGICKDLFSDSQNCGECGEACKGGKVCIQGFCVCSGDTPWECNGI